MFIGEFHPTINNNKISTDEKVSNSLDHIYREDGKGEILSTKSFTSQNEHYAEKRLESYLLQ
jgi:hypothetical protein